MDFRELSCELTDLAAIMDRYFNYSSISCATLGESPVEFHREKWSSGRRKLCKVIPNLRAPAFVTNFNEQTSGSLSLKCDAVKASSLEMCSSTLILRYSTSVNDSDSHFNERNNENREIKFPLVGLNCLIAATHSLLHNILTFLAFC